MREAKQSWCVEVVKAEVCTKIHGEVPNMV